MTKQRSKSTLAPEPREIHRQKLETIGALAGGIAHDFNNILTGILGHISFIKLALQEDSQTGESIAAIEQGARRAATLAQQILAFAKGEETTMGTVNLVTVVSSCIGLLSAALPKNVDISLSGTREELNVYGNESQLSQIVMNLTVNAVEAMPGGGSLKVSLSTKEMSVTALKERGLQLDPGEYAALIVEDTGIGITDAQKRNIFKPFFTTKGHGTGLGLATVLWITETHHGGICVASGANKGTKFEIYIPTSDIQAEETEEVTVPTSLDGSESILLIDDEESVRTVVSKSLEHLGYNVTTAVNGKEGLKRYASNPDRYDLVVVDMIMPEMAGDEFYRAAKLVREDVKVILCSGYSGTERAEEMLQSGALGFLQKPFVIEELVEQIRSIFDSEEN